MYRFIALLLTALFAVNNVAAFTSVQRTAVSLTHSQVRVASTPSFKTGAESSTSLNLKVKVDPKAVAGKNTKGNAKAAAYGGSVAIAALLPVAFLVWAALK